MDDKNHTKHNNGSAKDINIAVLGKQGVGKSALIVRYLTRRFIGDYDPEMNEIFKHNTIIDGKQVSVHIMDTIYNNSNHKIKDVRKSNPIVWADGFLLVYSITDRESFVSVQELVGNLRLERRDDRIPILIVGNKRDLIHMRQVSLEDCEEWTTDHNCCVCEVSASDDVDSVIEAFHSLFRQIKTVHRKREKLSWLMHRPTVSTRLQIRQSLRNLAAKNWRTRTATM